MTYKFDEHIIGYPPIESAPLAAPATGAFPAMTPGSLYTAEDPVWGPGEFAFGRANGSIRQYGLCVCTPVWDSTNRTYTQNFTEAPNTTLLGRPLYVAQSAGAMSSGQFGWFLTSGVTPVNSANNVAADVATGIVAAGQAGTLAAGKQLLNARVVAPSTTAVVSAAVSGVSGANTITVANAAGFIVGGTLTGTGVGASAVVSAINQNTNTLTVTVVNSAAVTGNVTCTYSAGAVLYNVIVANRMGAQGPIT